MVRSPGLGPLTATITSSAPGVGELVTQAVTGSAVTVQIAAGSSRSPVNLAGNGVEFQPVAAGGTTVSLAIPGYAVLPTASQPVTVTTPAITLNSTTTGAGLQRNVNGLLGASNHGGVQVIVNSSNFGVLRLATAPDAAGADSLVFTIPDGQTAFSYYVQGADGQTGNVSVTARANGFTDGTSTINVVPSAVDIIFLTSPQAVGGPDDAFQVRVGIPNQAQTLLAAELSRNGGAAPLIVDLTSGMPAVGTLVFLGGPAASGTIMIQPAQSRSPGAVATGGVAFRPLAAGTTILTALIPGFVTLPPPGNTVTVTVQ